MSRPFTHLHLHTQYSLLTGAIRVKDLMGRIKDAGMHAVAMTDVGNMFGAVDFQKRAKKAGVKSIIGVEVRVADGSRHEPKSRQAFDLVLLARDLTGYGNLRTLVSMSWLEGLHHGKPHVDLELLARHAEGVFALSGNRDNQIAKAVLAGRIDEARRLATAYRDTFEEGAFFLEVIPSGLAGQDKVNHAFRQLGTELGIPLVASNHVHYLDRKDARAHEVLMCIGYGRTLDDPDRPRLDVDSLWLKPPEVMWEELGADFADALENTAWIAESCDVEIPLGEVYLPSAPIDEPGYDEVTWLEEVSRRGLRARYAEFDKIGKTYDRAVYDARLEEELGIIISMKFPGYFLIVQDFIKWAKEQDIPVGPGRGSGAGSLVAYALRITDLDPIPYGLLFERFLNPERVSMPDFDIDFCMNRRGEVIDYVTRKYGEKQVGQIATFGGLKARGVIKDVGRVQGFSFGETDRLSKMVPDIIGITLEQALEQEKRLRELYQDDDRIRDLLDVARALEGLYKSTGMHAAGVVIGEMPLWEYVPVFRGANGELVTQFAKDEVEEAGLVKFDFLGLKTLTVIDDAVRMVNRARPDDPLDLDTMPLTDPGVYKLISKGDTEGVFQLESSGFQELLKKLKPDKFEDIVAAVALYRPGPLNSGMLDDFIERKHGRQKISYPHPKLDEILRETYGVIVYQEQVMQIAQVLAGFTLGAADLLRRAMGKKKFDVMAAQRVVFAEGALKLYGVDEAKASEIFDLMEKFAQYGFNKSHSGAYALLTYQTAYLKVHHRVEFVAALLTNDRDNPEKVAKGIRNAKKIDVEVLPPDVNLSKDSFDAVDGKVLFGMGGVKGVGSTAVDAIVEARQDKPFTSLFDFCERVDLRRVNKKTIEALIKTGAFDFCEHPRARLVAALDIAVERAQNTQRDKASGQANLFGMLAAPPSAEDELDDDALPPDLMQVGEWAEQELLANEKSVLGMYVSGHPLDRFADQIRKYANCSVENLGKRENYEVVTLGGIITSCRIRPFKSGDGRMAIMLFEDLTGEVEIIAMGDDFDRYEELLTSDEPLLIAGKVRIDRDEDRTNISVRLGSRRRKRDPEPETPDVLSLAAVRAERSRAVRVTFAPGALDRRNVGRLRAILGDQRFAGSCDTVIEMCTSPDYGNCKVTLTPSVKLQPSDALNDALRRVFRDRVQVAYK